MSFLVMIISVEFLVECPTRTATQCRCRNRVADHLPNMLKLLSVMPYSEIKKEMLLSAVIPAVKKMLATFSEGDDRCNPYKFVFQGLAAQLETEVHELEGVVYA